MAATNMAPQIVEQEMNEAHRVARVEETAALIFRYCESRTEHCRSSTRVCVRKSKQIIDIESNNVSIYHVHYSVNYTYTIIK